MTLDQENAELKYTKIVNAVIDDNSSNATTTLTFNSEILIPRQLPDDIATIYSPFVYVASIAKDILAYKRHFDERFYLVHEVWPVIKNASVHFENSNWSLYRKEFKTLENDIDDIDDQFLIAHCLRHLHQFSYAFRPKSTEISELVRQRINLAESINLQECNNIISFFDAIRWSESLFHEIQSIRNRWIDIYKIIQPLYLIFEWDESKHNLADYTIAQKRLDDIKVFYIDGFESLCRLSVLAGAFEGVISGNNGGVPDNRNGMTLDAYRKQTNGKKKNVVTNWCISNVFTPMADNQLRNGIGHHTCRYNVKNDNIEYRIENSSGITPMSIPYIEFCLKILQLYDSLELASIYLHWLQARKRGLKGKVV